MLPVHRRRLSVLHRFVAATAAALLGACGGRSPVATAPSEAATGLSGTVAVGAPLSDARVRVLDATGAVVASDIVVDADGGYSVPELTGTAPFRIEACGNAGAGWQCIYSMAAQAGTANVTPLTTASLLLASGQTPQALMAGSAGTPDAAALVEAQQQLRTHLTPVLDSSGVPADMDFFAGTLVAGQRTGYDRLLDSLGVTTGVDGQPFVQFTPRLGEGNLFMQSGSSSGALQSDAGASSLPLAGLETLFQNMTAAFASATACSDATTGLAQSLAANARMSMDGMSAQGAEAVAQALCGMMGAQQMFPARLLSPTLGRCDLSGAAPVCRVGFVLSDGQGGTQSVGGRMGATFEAGQWKFLGNIDPIELYATATAQRERRIDGTTPVDTYTRALAFEVAAVDGLQCARVRQRDADRNWVTVAYFKRGAGSDIKRLSLWMEGAQSNTPSLDPMSGAVRRDDDTWVTLPSGTAGDAVVRNFLRGGRTVSMELYSDAGCSTPLSIGGHSSFEVEVDGVPPVSTSLAGLPWPELTADSSTALRELTLPASTPGTMALAWTFPQGPLGLKSATVCSDLRACGDQGAGRIGRATLRPNSTGTTLELQGTAAGLAGGADRMFTLSGGDGGGLHMEANFRSCAQRPAGAACNE